LALIDDALRHAPDDADLLHARAATMNYCPGLPPALVARAHRHFGEREQAAAGPPLPAPPARRPGPLRAGFLSRDLRRQSVAFFVEPLLSHLDRATVEPLAFSTNAARDDVSARLRSLVAGWHDLDALNDRAAADLIRRLDVDLLIDLNGLTAGGRLGVMALRP